MSMKRRVASLFAVCMVTFAVTQAQATPIPISSLPPESANNWMVLDQDMNTGDFFTGGPYTITTGAAGGTLYITDLFVASDQFGVYNDGSFLFNTQPGIQWTTLNPGGSPYDAASDYTTDPNAAWSTTFLGANVFSQAIIALLPNTSYAFDFTDIYIPVQSVGGAPFPDGTIAFTAVLGVPEPSSLILGLTSVIALGGYCVRRRMARTR